MNPIQKLLGWSSAAEHFLGRTALPAVFGGGRVEVAPGEPNPVGQALQAFGAATTAAAGGPRQFGTFGPSPLAAVSAGLSAGTEVYQNARRASQRRSAYDAIPLPERGPTPQYLSRVAAEAMRQGDEPYARGLLSVLASGNAVGEPEDPNSLASQLTRARIDEYIARTEDIRRGKAPKMGTPHYVTGPDGHVVAVTQNPDGTFTAQPTGATARVPVAGGKTAGAVNQNEANASAAVSRLTEANRLMSESFNRNPANMTIPWRAAVPRLLAGMARSTTGGLDNPVSDGLDQLGLTEAQQEFRPMTDEWTHQYIVFLPRFRSGRDMYNNVKHAYFPPIGVTNRRVLRSYQERRENATRSIVAAQNRGATPDEIENMLLGDMERLLGRSLRPRSNSRTTTTEPAPVSADDFKDFQRTP